ncbi:MAG: FAD-binding oxidoreductase [Candidimonas sp.]|nr:MAG: FAD-binding oxidoreductase [Candidimonas sp.]
MNFCHDGFLSRPTFGGWSVKQRCVPAAGCGDGIYDAAVIGAGLVGAAIAYGLGKSLAHVALLDEGDVAYRASRGNFGLVWVQSKGMGMASYGAWTLGAARLWPTLAAALLDETGVDVHLEQRGGLHVMLSEDEVRARVSFMKGLAAQPGMPAWGWRLLDRHEVADVLPGAGPDVAGAIWTDVDGAVDPLRLLRALHAAVSSGPVHYLPETPACSIAWGNGFFRVATPRGRIDARKVVMAAGLGNAALAAQVGLSMPVRPQRGQIIVLERSRPRLSVPLSTLRQMAEGTWLIGDSQQDAGLDDQSVGWDVLATLADRARRTLPALGQLNAVRAWSALRVMPRDGFPIYEQSALCPGAFVAACHSGVTLAAAHALKLAPMIAAGSLSQELAPFSTRRFHVQAS